MWILHFLPDSFIIWFANTVLLAGTVLTLAGFFIHKIPVPLLYQYQLPFKILGILILCGGVYLRGGVAVEQAWRDRVAEVEARLRVAEQAAQDASARIETKVVNRTRVIKERGEEIIKYVDREVVKFDSKFAAGGICEIPREFIVIHNRAAEEPKK